MRNEYTHQCASSRMRQMICSFVSTPCKKWFAHFGVGMQTTPDNTNSQWGVSRKPIYVGEWQVLNNSSYLPVFHNFASSCE
eukprot:3714034-Amphidinium_carterae.1